MPYRQLVATQLAKLFGVLSHPTRIRIIEELREKDLSVNDLKEILGVPQAAVSQQLAILRSTGLISESRQGRLVFNHLRNENLATWVMDGAKFISPDPTEVQNMLEAIKAAKTSWHFES